MKHLIKFTACMLMSISAYGQSYSYSFNGELDIEDINAIEKECAHC